MQNHKNSKRTGFTLIEVVISVAIIAIILSILGVSSLMTSFQKGRDAKRKSDLNKMVRTLEDYYNDYNGYPPSDPQYSGTIDSHDWGSSFSPYLSSLPQDPLSPGSDYFYFGDPGGAFFAIFAKLENTNDPDIELTGCSTNIEKGCGPNLAYNYVVHSSNVRMLAGLPNGVAIPGYEGEEGEPGGGGGGGGGGEGEPTATAGPTSPPTPTTPPVPTVNPIGGCGPCGHEQVCSESWCGACAWPGVYCNVGKICCASFYPPSDWYWKCLDRYINGVINYCH